MIPENEPTFHKDSHVLHVRQAPLYVLWNKNLFYSIPCCMVDDLQILLSFGSLRRLLLNLPFPGFICNKINRPILMFRLSTPAYSFRYWKLIHCWKDPGWHRSEATKFDPFPMVSNVQVSTLQTFIFYSRFFFFSWNLYLGLILIRIK